VKPLRIALVATLLAAAAAASTGCQRSQAGTLPTTLTVGDLHAVHALVQVGGREARGRVRLADGDEVTTGPDGRARLRLDDGTLAVVGSGTRFTLRGTRIELAVGKLFLEGGATSRAEVALGDARTTVATSSVAFERHAGGAKIYCAEGELMLESLGKRTRVASGETATLAAGRVEVAPEKAFDDWTGGLAVPFRGDAGHSAIAELRSNAGGTEAGPPLVVRSQKIDVRIDGELAITRARATYFNGLDHAVQADVRLALPAGAILSRVARRLGNELNEQDARLMLSPPASTDVWSSTPRLEWAGDGFLRGVLPSIESGKTLELILEYAEWLPVRGGRASYRFPMASEGAPPLVGELFARVDAEKSGTTFLAASAGSKVTGRTVELRKTDVRPSGDLVVEYAPSLAVAGRARAYVMPAPSGEDSYVLVRTEVPERSEPGITLAVVVDTSMSVGAANLETARAVIDAILEGLGPRDSVVVIGADQLTRAIGPETPQPVTPELRNRIRAELARVRPGGASHLALALERGADVLDAGGARSSGMLVYVGDGRPTVGPPDAEQIRRRLGQRTGGVPRVGAVAVGPGADRWLLARLVTGAGSVYEVADRADAARAGAALLADALEPTLRDVELDLGPTVDRVYPREARAALAGGTVSVVGRLRGKLPASIGFRFRDGAQQLDETRPLKLVATPAGADLPRRWALARLEELAVRGDGLEPGITLAASTGLLTPFTSFFFEPMSEKSQPSTPFRFRVQALSPELDRAFAPYVDTPVVRGSTLLEPPRSFGGGVSLRDAAEAAAQRTLNRARNAVRACRDARAAVRPEVTNSFRIELEVSAEGRAARVRVELDGSSGRDPVLERCVENVVKALPYFAAGAVVNVHHVLEVPEGQSARRTKCTPTARLSLPIRKSVWRARKPERVEAYLEATRGCELTSWLDRREFLLLLLERVTDGAARMGLAGELDAAGESDAAAFVRKEALRRVSSFAELEQLARSAIENEPVIDAELEQAYRAAKSDEQRLTVVQRFLLLAPHSPLARRRLFTLLEALKRNDALLQAIDAVRSDPFADAGLLAQGASALRRLGLEPESRRAFGELIERAPGDPWTLAYVGDRLRGEGLLDEAVDAYESLARLMPNDAAVSLRLALAHAAAGRLDAATRLLERVTQTGGRGDDGRLGELAAVTEAVLVSAARPEVKDGDVSAELARRLAQTPLPDVASLIFVEAPPADDPVAVSVTRENGEKGEQSPDLDAHVLGLSVVRVERGDGALVIRLRHGSDAGPGLAQKVRISALALGPNREQSRLMRWERVIPADGKPVDVRWNGETLL
jgi:tetratricopeptide (TPR) repeat protein/Mg-chelatase subunit ChlD